MVLVRHGIKLLILTSSRRLPVKKPKSHDSLGVDLKIAGELPVLLAVVLPVVKICQVTRGCELAKILELLGWVRAFCKVSLSVIKTGLIKSFFSYNRLL